MIDTSAIILNFDRKNRIPSGTYSILFCGEVTPPDSNAGTERIALMVLKCKCGPEIAMDVLPFGLLLPFGGDDLGGLIGKEVVVQSLNKDYHSINIQ